MSTPVPLMAKTMTYFLEILVRDKGKSELGTTSDDTSRTTFPESPEAFFAVWTCRGDKSAELVAGDTQISNIVD